MALEFYRDSGSTIRVDSTSELEAAYLYLSDLPDGGTILVSGEESIRLALRDEPTQQNLVRITSEDPNNPARFNHISLRAVENVHIDTVVIDSRDHQGRSEAIKDLAIQNTRNVSIRDSIFRGNAETYLERAGDKAESLGVVMNSSDFRFDGNTISNYFHGLSVQNSTGITITENDVSLIQGDGFRLGGVESVVISKNYIHDFLGAGQHLSHNDMIQFWGVNADRLTRDVVISDNILSTAGSGRATQGIFIRNEYVGEDGETGNRFENITISGNLIYNGHHHGIAVADTHKLVLENNTLLWDQTAMVERWGQQSATHMPRILIRNTVEGVVEKNIAPSLVIANSPEVIALDYAQIEYHDRLSEDYVEKRFVNALEDVPAIDDLTLFPNDAWTHFKGSSLSWALHTRGDVRAISEIRQDPSDSHKIVFDATKSLDADGIVDPQDYEFQWHFSDGTKLTGAVVEHRFDDPGKYTAELRIFQGGKPLDNFQRVIELESADMFAFDFENGLEDSSYGGTIAVQKGQEGLQIVDGDEAFKVSTNDEVLIAAETHGLKAFSLAFDIKPAAGGSGGVFLDLKDTMTGKFWLNGNVIFQLRTDAGDYVLESGVGVINDGDWHRVRVSFDGNGGFLKMYVDGQEVASTDASGMLLNRKGRDLFLGNTFKESADVFLDDLSMSANPDVDLFEPANSDPDTMSPAETDYPETFSSFEEWV